MRLEALTPARLVPAAELGGLTARTASPQTPGTDATESAGASLESSFSRPAAGSQPSFGTVLGQAVERVNGLLGEADTQAQRVATGETQDLHEAMVALAEADLALQLTTRVSQKAISAYQEISRMQV
jgi:flagellar hook-basal body complex protein FliE